MEWRCVKSWESRCIFWIYGDEWDGTYVSLYKQIHLYMKYDILACVKAFHLLWQASISSKPSMVYLHVAYYVGHLYLAEGFISATQNGEMLCYITLSILLFLFFRMRYDRHLRGRKRIWREQWCRFSRFSLQVRMAENALQISALALKLWQLFQVLLLILLKNNHWLLNALFISSRGTGKRMR